MENLNLINDFLGRQFVLLDGAMGTMLLQKGMKPGQRPELMNIINPEAVYDVHRAYLEAGSNIIYTNTFGVGAPKLEGTGYTTERLTKAAVAIACAARAHEDAFVALDIGPLGELLEPMGTLRFEDAYAYFRQQVLAGEEAGADIIVIETMSDLYEVKAALLAATENTNLPVMATMSFETNGRTFSGCGVEAMAATLEGLGACAIGINCSLGPKQIYPLIQKMASVTQLPLIVKANAGLPDARDGSYATTPEQFAQEMAAFTKLGVRYMGGCCGTTPDYIRALRQALEGKERVQRTVTPQSRVCTPTRVVTLDSTRVIGERINPTGKKRLRQALMDGDMDYVLTQAVEQEQAGADILDVNVGVPGLDEVKTMRNVVKALQSVTELPLQIDSNNPEAIEAGLRACNGKAIVNSVNGEAQVLETILPIVKKYGAAVVGLTLDENGIPETAEERYAIAERILNVALRYDIPKCDIYIDCLTLTVSAQQDQARQTLRAMRMVRDRLGLHTVLGVSNISFGLPRRDLITRTFLSMALQSGLTLPIINPNDQPIMDTIAAFRVLDGIDEGCRDYVDRYAGVENAPQHAPTSDTPDLGEAVRNGLRGAAQTAVRAMLETHGVDEVINGVLIPALDDVGERFERGELFLPQLMRAADAACEAFDVVKSVLAKSGGDAMERGKVVLATVRGDIHDIGKNIVKVILENYGYKVVDLGRDVAPETVLEAVRRENAPLVGLSALMTTTLPAMVETIALLHKNCDCKVMVGGAVLTPSYAEEIGADFYAKDAKASADIAKSIF